MDIISGNEDTNGDILAHYGIDYNVICTQKYVFITIILEHS